MEELKLFHNDNKYRKKLNEKIMKRNGVTIDNFFGFKLKDGTRTNMYSNIIIPKKRFFIYYKNGIEVLNFSNDERMKGNRFTIKELKQRLKDNKIKGYSKLKKKEIIKKLIKL